MVRRILCSSILAAVMVFPAVVSAQPIARQPQNQQQQTAKTKTVSGTVTAIGSDRKSFSMDVKDSNSSQTKTMQFYIDQSTQVQGHVGIGTKANVQYQSKDDGRNLALNVSPMAGQ